MSAPRKTRSRAERLDLLLKKWIFNTAHAIDFESFLSHFAPIIPGHKRELKNSLVQGLEYFKSELEKLSAKLEEEYEFSNKTNLLEQLIEDARRQPPVNERIIPTARQVMFAVKTKSSLREYEELQNELDKIKEENRKQMERHLELSRQIINKRREISNQIQELEEMIEEIQTIPTEELLELVNELDVVSFANQQQ